ncbi:hypothetical protein C8F01DRAFT_1285021 [Mycena amicta]|nr:hypothetical protein C8F01DRAFT_1285021 [Mycena amicta]
MASELPRPAHQDIVPRPRRLPRFVISLDVGPKFETYARCPASSHQPPQLGIRGYIWELTERKWTVPVADSPVEADNISERLHICLIWKVLVNRDSRVVQTFCMTPEQGYVDSYGTKKGQLRRPFSALIVRPKEGVAPTPLREVRKEDGDAKLSGMEECVVKLEEPPVEVWVLGRGKVVGHSGQAKYMASVVERNEVLVLQVPLPNRALTVFDVTDSHVNDGPSGSGGRGLALGGLKTYEGAVELDHNQVAIDPRLAVETTVIVEKVAYGSRGGDEASSEDNKFEIWVQPRRLRNINGDVGPCALVAEGATGHVERERSKGLEAGPLAWKSAARANRGKLAAKAERIQGGPGILFSFHGLEEHCVDWHSGPRNEGGMAIPIM